MSDKWRGTDKSFKIGREITTKMNKREPGACFVLKIYRIFTKDRGNVGCIPFKFQGNGLGCCE